MNAIDEAKFVLGYGKAFTDNEGCTVAITIKLLSDLIEAIEKRDILLDVSACPQCGDKSGAYYDNNGDICQCQWCDEVNKLK